MNSEYCFGAAKKRIMLNRVFQIKRNQSCLPVIAMNNIRFPKKFFAHLQYRLGKGNKALVIIGIIISDSRIVIESHAGKILFAFDEVDLYAGALGENGAGFNIDSRIFISDGNFHSLRAIDDMDLLLLLADEAVSRHDDADVMMKLAQGLRQRGTDVCQAAGFCVREDFAGNKEDAAGMDFRFSGLAHESFVFCFAAYCTAL